MVIAIRIIRAIEKEISTLLGYGSSTIVCGFIRCSSGLSPIASQGLLYEGAWAALENQFSRDRRRAELEGYVADEPQASVSNLREGKAYYAVQEAWGLAHRSAHAALRPTRANEIWLAD
jgi:hypothetical protein